MITATAIHRLLTDSAHYFGLLPTPARTVALLRTARRQVQPTRPPANDGRHLLSPMGDEDQSCCA
ncbi:MAG TPA: hypothetical protein PK620_16185 [Denitromonas sp.]|uniref:hypothetical protein n=1 Tax=Denitromonas sp. TaxID=2734609 RepID=UPI001D33D52D|nr:hypothetical protein [Rhodocyclaceae bacterium]MCP5221415.1 hypothetical protein [Zoogloeaceae bacterium]HPR05862.1 hypothetical protein [Denitromonas sp.]HQU90320.1 hypothetical protein [Denitromonas sp.]HQV16449.1 hypothetical protein [Denitromonas sp.]